MFKRNDYVILAIICFFLGIFLVSQFYAGQEYKALTQPENNEVIALEVAKLTRSNANLRREVQDLTSDLNIYQTLFEQKKTASDKYQADRDRLSIIVGSMPTSGQGVIIKINGKMTTPQLVDLINAIKNIGTEVISLNNQRVTLNTNLNLLSGLPKTEISVLGNSKLLKSAMERKGGIIDQLAGKDLLIRVLESDKLEIKSGQVLDFKYAKIVSD